MLPALAGMAVKALLPSTKRIDKDKVFDRKKSSAIQKVDSERGIIKQPVIRKKSISTDLFLPPAKSGQLAVVDKKVSGGSLKKLFNDISGTLNDIIDTLKNKQSVSQANKRNKRKEDRSEEIKKREAKLEKRKRNQLELKPKLPGDKFNIMKFFENILIGSIVLAIFKNLEKIVNFFKGIYNQFKDFVTKLGEVLSPIWNGLKWIAGGGTELIGKLLGIPPENLSDKDILKNLNEIKNKIPFLENLFKGIKNTIDSIRGYKEPTSEGASAGEGQIELPSGITSVQGGGSDFWTLVAVVSREDGDPQGRADVAQSIYNRLASGAYTGKNLREIILARTQYQPTWDYPRKGKYGIPNPEWYNITDAKSAAAASGMSESAMRSVASQLLDPNLQRNAAEFVQGRTDFTNYTRQTRKGQIQRKSGDNYFGWDWNYQGNKVASVPSFGSQIANQSSQQKQQQADLRAQQAASAASTPTPAATPSGTPAQTGTPPSLQPTTQAQVAPTQAPPSVSASVPQIMQQADYEIPGGVPSSTILPIPIGGGSSPMMMGGGGTTILPIGMSKTQALNSYYQTQLIGFLYKQG